MTAPIVPVHPSAGVIVRRLIVYVLLFALMMIAAGGLSGLLGRLIDARSVLAGDGASGLAQSLAFAVIGGPLAAVLWQVNWTRLRDPAERVSLGWGLYVSAVSTVSLVTSANALLGAAAAGIDGEWRSQEIATGIVFAGLLVWHGWMARHPQRGPLRFTEVARVIGWVYGLAISIGGIIVSLGGLLDEAVARLLGLATIGEGWWRPVLAGLVWAVGGAVIWWWFVYRARRGPPGAEPTGFGQVALVLVGIGAGVVLALGGAGFTLYVVLDLVFGREGAAADKLQPLGAAMAASLTGFVVWAYHRSVLRGSGERTSEGSRLLVSGLALIATASGLGVIVNATLAALAPTLVESDVRALLLGGVSSLLIGAPVWILVWRPRAVVDSATAGSMGRRIYLIAVFGLSAVVAIITLLVTGFRVFEYLLLEVTGASLIDRVRASLGLLVATALVAGYHYARWRTDRVLAGPGESRTERPASERAIGEVLLVAGGDSEGLARFVGELTGASVTLWERDEPAGVGPDVAAIAAALDGVTAHRVLLLVGPGAVVEVIPVRTAAERATAVGSDEAAARSGRRGIDLS